MAKPRKMLGDVKAAYCVDMMRLIETHSQHDLALWAADFAETVCMPVLQAHGEAAAVYAEALAASRSCAQATMPAKAVRPVLKAAREAAAAVEDPTAQAAARALAVAAAVCVTPTNALGYLFYACAAEVYHRCGVGADAACCESGSAALFMRAADALRAMPHDGGRPVQVDWCC